MNIPYVFKKCTKCGEWKVANNVNFFRDKKGKYGLRGQCKICYSEQRKQYYEENKEKIIEQHKQYREENKYKIAEQRKQHYKENRDMLLEYKKQYYIDNKEKVKEKIKRYYQENKEKKAEYNKQYREKNKERLLDYGKQYYKQYYEENKEKVADQHKQYRQTPQGQVSAFNRSIRRRVRKENQGNGITKEQWLEMMNFFNWKCAYSNEVLSEKRQRSIDHIKPLNKGGEHEVWNVVPMYRPYNSSKHDNEMLEWYKKQDFYSEERLQKIYEWQEYAFNKWGYEETPNIKEI